jgi:hypothetical protein
MVTDTETPEGPTGVWLEYADGQRYTDLPVIYLHTSEAGIAHFEVLVPRELESPVAAGAAVWPGKTSLVLPMLKPGGDT